MADNYAGGGHMGKHDPSSSTGNAAADDAINMMKRMRPVMKHSSSDMPAEPKGKGSRMTAQQMGM